MLQPHPLPLVCTILILLSSGCSLFFQAGDESQLKAFEFTQTHMGSPFHIKLFAESENKAKQASAEAYKRIAELNSILSDYDMESELSKLSKSSKQGVQVPLSPDLQRVLKRSVDLANKTNGAFDITIGPAVLLWRQATFTKRLPEERKIRWAQERIGIQNLQLSPDGKKAKLLKKSMRLDLGGIAKGYACDEALKVLKQHSIHRAIVDGGGDVAIGDPPPGADGWVVQIQNVKQVIPDEDRSRNIEDVLTPFLTLANCAVATSGNASRKVEIDGKIYSHIVNPKTCLGLTHEYQVTVVAPTATDADALASAMSVLGREKCLPIAAGMRKELGRFEVYFVKDGVIRFGFK